MQPKQPFIGFRIHASVLAAFYVRNVRMATRLHSLRVYPDFGLQAYQRSNDMSAGHFSAIEKSRVIREHEMALSH